MKKIHNISIIGNSFEKDIGQGIDKCCGYLYDGLKDTDISIKKIRVPISNNPIYTFFMSTFGVFFKLIFNNSNLYHFTLPTMALPCLFKRPSIVTIYDLIPFVLKNERKKSYNLYFKFMLWFVKKADHIIVISKSTLSEVITYLNVSPENITLIYPGVDHTFFFPKNNLKKTKVFSVGFLGGIVKRKNAKILLEVAEKLKDENIFFKIAGAGKGLDNLKKLKKEKKINNVDFLGFIPDNSLNDFYNSCDVFVAPTTYDGFCMPGMEAMATGCPVILSNRGALPEVAGDAGLLINPYSSDEISDAILKIKNNLNLRNELSKKSLEHSKKFSWGKNVSETFKVYKKFMR